MDRLSYGSTGGQVRLLRRLLNKAARADRISIMRLADSGNFSEEVDAALRAYQARHHHLGTPGICDMQVWRALGLSVDRLHDLELIGQPDDTSCWATAASMILGNRSAYLPEPLGGPEGLEPSEEGTRAFASALGWRRLDHSPGAGELTELLERTPLWVGCFDGDWSHAIVFSGVRGDRTFEGTMVRIHDPGPVGAGMIYGTFLDGLYSFDDRGRRVPMSLDHIMVPPH